MYTSGSTAEPRGVMITHRNALANCAYVTDGGGYDAESVALSWVPPHHDMGLVIEILQPLWAQFPSLLMSPMAFLQAPRAWLEAIGRHRVRTPADRTSRTIWRCGGCRPAIAARAPRLSAGWKLAYTSAEPVRRDTIDRFSDAFAACGFARTAVYPAYGLAEATLKVTGGPRGVGADLGLEVDPAALAHDRIVLRPPAAPPLVASRRGVPVHARVEIVADGVRRAPDRVSEIWVSGPSVAVGSAHGRPDENEAVFGARLPGSDEIFLRTGDLGFVRDGQLVRDRSAEGSDHRARQEPLPAGPGAHRHAQPRGDPSRRVRRVRGDGGG